MCKRKPNYSKLLLNYINVFPCKLLLTFRTLQLANQFVSVYVFQAEGQTNNSFTIKINLIIKYRNFRRKTSKLISFNELHLVQLQTCPKFFSFKPLKWIIFYLKSLKVIETYSFCCQNPEEKSPRPKIRHAPLRQARIRKNSKKFRNLIFFL